MKFDEPLIDVKKADLNELKELKVKIPVRLLVNLHYVKLTQSRPISEVVNEALTQYFAARVNSRPSEAPTEVHEATPSEVLTVASRLGGPPLMSPMV